MDLHTSQLCGTLQVLATRSLLRVPVQDFYDVLGVDRGADKKAIKTAYRQKARQYHPDVNKEDGAEEKFKRISNAYEVLSDDSKRGIYDRCAGVQCCQLLLMATLVQLPLCPLDGVLLCCLPTSRRSLTT